MACTEVKDIIDKFRSFTQKPVKFMTVQEGVKEDIKNLVKSLYDYTKSQEKGEKKEKKAALSELIVKDFDEEQIWQEIELQNSECWDNLVWEVANCISNKNVIEFPVEVHQEQEHESDEENQQSEDEKPLSEDQSESEEKAKKKKDKKSKIMTKTSVVDDKFFKLQEMEKFLLQEERRDTSKQDSGSDDESIDMFEDIDDERSGDDEGGKDKMYSDFFDRQDEDQELQDQESDPEASEEESDMDNQEFETNITKKGEKRVKFADLMPDDDYESDNNDDSTIAKKNMDNKINGKTDNEQKSDFELRQQRLQQTITRLEEKTLKDAPWQLKGEVDAARRPQNSLLQEVIDFDLTTRPPPIITEETTVTLEDIIRRRIKDKAWDDVVKKQKPVDDQLTFRKPEVLDQSKSKLSLAQVYEAEYLKQKQVMSGDNEEEKESEAHTQIRDSMSKLFSKLDALCHYHYTPKPPQAEVKIVSNTPAISMEEVAPVATSDAALLAPEEVKRKRRGELTSKEERTQTDKKRERRKKKKLQQKKGKVTKVTEHRNTKKGVEANDKSLKTSKAFFQQLNDDSTSIIKSKNKRNVKNKGQ